MNVPKLPYRFVPMTGAYAREIFETWHYDEPYGFYDYAYSSEILDPDNWETGQFAVLDQAGELVGEFTIYFEDEQMSIGFGLRPDLTGKGLGYDFISAGIEFAVRAYQYRGRALLLFVAAWNERALRLYRKLGFEEVSRFTDEVRGTPVEFIRMRKLLQQEEDETL